MTKKKYAKSFSKPLPIPLALQSAALQFQDRFQLETLKPIYHLQYLPSQILPEKHISSWVIITVRLKLLHLGVKV